MEGVDRVMSDYQFILGNALVILFMALGLGFLGGAESFFPDDVVIGDAQELVESGEVSNVSEVDFDTGRLLYQPNFSSFETMQTSFSGYIWNGQGSNGSVSYDVSGVDGVVVESREAGLIPAVNLDNLFLLKDGVKEQVTTSSKSVDLSGVSNLTVVLTSTDAEFLGFGETVGGESLEIEDFTSINNLQTISYDVQQGLFVTLTDYIGYAFVGIVEIFAVLKAWFDFIYIMPGLAGWVLKGYIGVFVAYFVVKEVWLG